jgi:hypothetical protein
MCRVSQETGFFCSWGGSWDSPYGRFFLSWYSGALLDHGDRMLRAAASVFNVAHARELAPTYLDFRVLGVRVTACCTRLQRAWALLTAGRMVLLSLSLRE